jgi:hypothetical protein
VSGLATGNTLEFIPNRPYLRAIRNPGLSFIGHFGPQIGNVQNTSPSGPMTGAKHLQGFNPGKSRNKRFALKGREPTLALILALILLSYSFPNRTCR